MNETTRLLKVQREIHSLLLTQASQQELVVSVTEHLLGEGIPATVVMRVIAQARREEGLAMATLRQVVTHPHRLQVLGEAISGIRRGTEIVDRLSESIRQMGFQPSPIEADPGTHVTDND